MGRRQNDGLLSDAVEYDPMRDLFNQGSATVDLVLSNNIIGKILGLSQQMKP
jgi:hypothetical protein